MQKITNNLWFDTQAEEAAKYYTSIFKNSKIGKIARYGKAGYETHKMPAGTVMTVELEIEGQTFVALNGGPAFKFNEAVSFVINCKDQGEIDFYWNKLIEGGDPKAQICGWLKDKYGVSWQVVPTALSDMMSENSEKSERVMAALLKMKKLDAEVLKKAYDGELIDAIH